MFKNKAVMALLALVIAFGLWAYVITFVSSEREETFYDIPVSYQGEAIMNERRLMILGQTKPTVTLTLYGKRAELSKLTVENITILVDLSKIGEPGTHALGYNIYYPGDVPDNAFSVQSQYPNMVSLTVERRVTKEVQVEVNFQGRVPEGYIADREKMELDRETVTVSGPASAVDQITKANVTVDLEGRVDSFSESYRYTLCNDNNEPVDAQMVETNAAEVNVTLYIQRVLEIPLKVTVIDGGGATQDTSEITYDPELIKISGSESALEQLEEGLNIGSIDLSELTGDSVKTFPIVLPEGVENLSGKTEATVTVKFPELRTKTLTISSEKFEALNVPEGLEVSFITSELTVTVRGTKELINKLTSGDISVTVDFANAQAGSYTVKANVVMGEGFTAAGTIGTYKISATLQEPEAQSDEGA